MSQLRLQALIVDSDAEGSAALVSAASRHNCAVTRVGSPVEALVAVDRQAFDVAVVDLPAGDDAAVSLLRMLGDRQPAIALVVTSAAPTVETAILAYEHAAFRFVPKPYDVERLVDTLREAVAHACTAMQNAQLHARVRRGKQEWEQTFDAISDAIAVFDARGELLRGNTALSRHLGVPVTALMGRSCREVGFCGGGCPACAVCQVGHDESHAEVTLPGGQIFSVTTFPVAGGPDGAAVVQVAKDVTEEITSARRMREMGEDLAAANRRSMAALVQLKAAQAQLVQAEKLSAIGHLVAGVAHELNNPLTSILGYAQLLEEELDAPRGSLDGRALAPDARRIAEESERAARIVRNLLAFARRQAAVRAPLDVAELFERTVTSREQALRSAGITVERAFDQDLPPVVADGTQLQQALMNLVLNAEHAMRHREVRRLRVGARFDEAAAAIELFVTDSGHGIEQANLTRIFDPFFTTREVGEGAGLGLSICYGIVRRHGGQILVDTTNAGTTFSLLLPASVDEAPSRDVLVAHTEGESSVIGAALEGWGYRVVSVTTSSAALERYSRGVHAVFLDTGLLGADDAAWRAARARDLARTPLVLMGVCEDAAVDRFRREHAGAVLVPPFQLRPLRAAVRAFAKEYV